MSLLLAIYVWWQRETPRARTFAIQGIYSTSLEEFDELYIYADLGQSQRLNDWHENQVSGYEVILVEREPSIGGRMAQLDETFPTLDCSA